MCSVVEEDAQRRVVEDGRGDLLGRADHAAGRAEPLLELLHEPLEELDVLRLLLGEAQERAHLVVVAVHAPSRACSITEGRMYSSTSPKRYR